MKYITYTPELESFEAKNFKTDKDYFNLVRNMSTYAYDKDDKKFMRNFAGQFPFKAINTNSVKEFVASLWTSKILMKGDLTNRTLSADDKRIRATVKPKSDRKKSSPAKKGVSGVYDPNIFKVVFLAGGPGSGKSAIAKALFGMQGNFSYTGLKNVNSDRFFEYLLKKEGIPSDFRNMPKEQFEKITQGEGSIRDRAKNLNVAQFDSWIKGRLGVIIDGTGDNAKKLINQAKYLKDTYGYEPFMVFVNTTLNKAIERNNKRDRKLPEALVREIWNSAQQALKEYKAYFKSNFVEIDNSRDVSKIEIDRKIQKEVSAFLRKPISNAKAKEWIKSELSKKAKGISGSLYQKFQEVAKKTNFNLRGASLPAFLKWMNANAKELFGKSIATKKWFTLLDEYPQIMDAMASAQIDTEPLEDEDENKVERYYANAKKTSGKIGNVSKIEDYKKKDKQIFQFIKSIKGVDRVLEASEFPDKYGTNLSYFDVRYKKSNSTDTYNKKITYDHDRNYLFISNVGYSVHENLPKIKAAITKALK